MKLQKSDRDRDARGHLLSANKVSSGWNCLPLMEFLVKGQPLEIWNGADYGEGNHRYPQPVGKAQLLKKTIIYLIELEEYGVRPT